MKKLLLFLVAMSFTSCEKVSLIDDIVSDEECEEVNGKSTKNFTFTIKGDFGAATFTRGYLQADGSEMTDLWVFDYVGGICVQSVHQTALHETWGKPQMSLTYGNHHVYFIASRGDSPSVDPEGHVIVWGTPRDTFWKDYEVNVVSTSNGNRAVTLDRVVTKLRIAVDDEVPTGCSYVSVLPSRWYYGLDYVTGEAVSLQQKEKFVNVPDSYAGTTGQLALGIYGISGADEWNTNIVITAKDAQNNIIGQASIIGAPFKRNRATEYSGNLFASGGGFNVLINENWENPKVETW